MQKVTGAMPSWQTTKTQSKKGFDKAWGWAGKLGAPINRLSNKIGSEAFWPTEMDKESDKAARILKSFCKDGFYVEDQEKEKGKEKEGEQPGPKGKQRVLKKIPQKVIENAVGLAIFTTMRTGLWISGAGGSGVLVARQEDGSWSPPSGILLHTAGLGFLVGVDIYDCVLVINNRKALEAFTKLRATLGGEISAVAGPVGMGGVLENDGKWKQANRPVFTYLKSRGFYAGVQVDGTIVIERTDENARFYGEKVGVADILAGKVKRVPPETKKLMETLKAAEGRTDLDQEILDELEGEPAPGDVEVEAPRDAQMFGIPEPDDPDPYGAIALEKEGLEIREAGTGSRPTSAMFEYHPSASSPTYKVFHRISTEIPDTRSNRWSDQHTRGSYVASDAGTQTEMSIRPRTKVSSMTLEDESVEGGSDSDTPVSDTQTDLNPYSSVGSNPWSREHEGPLARDYELANDDEGKQTTGVVDVPKKVPPPLPPRTGTFSSTFEDVDLDRDASEVGEVLFSARTLEKIETTETKSKEAVGVAR